MDVRYEGEQIRGEVGGIENGGKSRVEECG